MTVEELAAEVVTLKRQLRWTLRGAFWLLFLGFFMFFSPFRLGLASYGTVNFGTVRAERFEAVDSSGNQRAFLTAGGMQPQLHLLGANGGGFSLITSDNQTDMNIWAGKAQFSLSVDPTTGSTAQVSAYDRETKSGVGLDIRPKEGPTVTLTRNPEPNITIYPPTR